MCCNSSLARRVTQYSRDAVIEAAAYWIPAFAGMTSADVKATLAPPSRRPATVLCAVIDMRAHFAADAGMVLVEPVQFVAISMFTSIRRRSIGASVSVSNAFTGFSAPAMSVPTTSSRFSIRMP